MRILKDLKIRMKMILGFGCILFLLVVMNGVSLVNMRKISNKAVEVVTRSENFSQTDVTMITDQANGVILVQDILFVLIVIAALVTAFKMSRDITKPLRELEDNMKLLSKGNFDITIRNDSLDEIGQLGRQMKKMSEDMKRYIRDITGTLGEIADGNVTVMVSGEYEGEYREIKSSLNLIAGSLNEVVEQMQTCAVQVERGAQGLSGNATDLSAGAMKQASAIEEFRRYLSRVSDLTKEDAKNAVMIKEIAGKAMQAVKESNTQMDRMREAMSNIASSSQEIEKVSKIIEDIALQTNILALNAATEAARAGEAGKGFSVVADEVRSLAAKSKEAAGTITTMINGSVNLVQGGLEVSETMSSCLSEVKNQVVSVSDQLINIDSSTREQAEAFGVMEDSLENIQEIVSSNTAAAEHNAEASGELIAQSDALNKMIRRFHLSV